MSIFLALYLIVSVSFFAEIDFQKEPYTDTLKSIFWGPLMIYVFVKVYIFKKEDKWY